MELNLHQPVKVYMRKLHLLKLHEQDVLQRLLLNLCT